MTVKAPFAFARIPRAVWYPDWGDRVSHDVPFKDGWSGALTLKLTAATELLIGGERRKATDQQAGEVWPVQLPDGTYAIPPSSLQGMIRNIMEIACFGKLGPWVEDNTYEKKSKPAKSNNTAKADSAHKMLGHSSQEHVGQFRTEATSSGKLDLPSLIFGAVGDAKEGAWFRHSLKRRAAFGWGCAVAGTKAVAADYEDKANVEYDKKYVPATAADASVLLEPKPTYFPIYVRQHSISNSPSSLAHGETYASYEPAKSGSNATSFGHSELSGIKIWPATLDSRFSALPRAPIKAGNNSRRDANSNSTKTQVKLNALPAGTTFDPVTLHIHNLRAVELGALIWALTLGQDKAIGCGESPLRHRIGMGKPFGMGSLKLSIAGGNLVPNASPRHALKGEVACAQMRTMMADFVRGMDKVCDGLGSWKNGTVSATPANPVEWTETVQVLAVRKAAAPISGKPDTYMQLGSSADSGNGTYIGERKASNFLLPFNNDEGWELIRSGDDTSRPPTQNDGQLNHQNNAPARGRRDTVKGGSAAKQSRFPTERRTRGVRADHGRG